MTPATDTFFDLCRESAVQLQAEDPDAVARGEQFLTGGVWCQIYHNADRRCALLIYNLGEPDPDKELELYRELLQIQSMFAGNLEAMFIRDPINETLLYTVAVQVSERLTAERLAETIRRHAAQVEKWGATLLKGLFFDYERLAEQLMARKDAAPSHLVEV